MLRTILLIALSVASASANLNFQNCGSQSNVQALRIRGCESTPCHFERGGQYYGEVDVIKAVNTPVLPVEVLAVPGFPFPAIPVFSGDLCQELIIGTCPTVAGEFHRFRIYIDLPATGLPPVNSLNVRIVIRDGLNQTQVCMQFPVTVV
ncbi:hypothetical protein Bhyg_02197 [Pseudolycoriella hygida]|uniref:MD-2-related lipid-recognition domain-containing protein n=1 Tax=Pseudolycoriella hygida TaxID=35572 RepID=A0A9Q0NAV8_9DIPT|nr:hypothetical protein Bhyg_02197 [Pseudolycoriella hygida]